MHVLRCESSEGCKCAVIGARECIHHCIDGHDESFDGRSARAGVVVACWWDGTPQRAAGDNRPYRIFEFRPVHRVRGGKVAIAS